MFIQIPAVDPSIAGVSFSLHPLTLTDGCLARYKNGTDTGLRLAFSDRICLTSPLLSTSALTRCV